MKTELIALDFNGRAVAAYIIDGQEHALTDEQVGQLLGYTDPAKAVSNLAARNTEELDGLSTTLNLRKVEGGRGVSRKIRVWGREGVIAIAFLANTEVSAQVRVWGRKALMAKIDEGKNALPAQVDPLIAVDRLANNTNHFAETVQNVLLQVTGQVGEVAGKVVQHDAAIKALQEFRENVDPHQLAIEAADIEAKRKRKLGELRGELGKLVSLIVRRAKSLPDEDVMAKSWSHPSRVWPPIHRHVGLNRLDDYTEPDQFERAIQFARNTLRQLGEEPPVQLRLVG